MLYGRYNELVNGVYKPTHNWGGTIITRGWIPKGDDNNDNKNNKLLTYDRGCYFKGVGLNNP